MIDPQPFPLLPCVTSIPKVTPAVLQDDCWRSSHYVKFQPGRRKKKQKGHTPSLRIRSRSCTGVSVWGPFNRIYFGIRKAAKYSFYSSGLQAQVRIRVFLAKGET